MKAKNIVVLLFTAVIGCAVAKTYSDLQEENRKDSDVKKEEKVNVKKNVKTEEVQTELQTREESVAQAIPHVEESKSSYGEFVSSLKSGVIGLYGGNSIDNPEDNIFEVTIPSTLTSTDRVVLSYDVEGVAGSTGVVLSINDHIALGGMIAYSSDKVSNVSEEIDANWIVKGKNRFMFTLPDSANYGYKISNLKIAVAEKAAKGNIVATATNVEGKVYVKGFVRNSESKTVYINANEYELNQGAFEALINNDVDAVSIGCDGANKTLKVTTVPGCIASTRLMCASRVEKHSQKEISLLKNDNNKLQDVSAALDVDSGVAKKDMKITMTNLNHKDLPALDLGMHNVTDGVEGYRFLPHGAHFDGDGAVVSLKYDRTKIPSGYTENDIRTYYFDLDTKHWVALKRDTIDKENNLIVSRTNHFTDMINGVIQAPESPETQGFTPTMMSDLKLADPTAKIQSIAPPTANNRGSANLSYSFEMPPARHGMQPNLGIQYNSDGGSGLLGEGWDLSVPTISVETRWGVPRYDSINESETYLMEGSMLVMENGNDNYLAHRASDQIKRKNGPVTFHPRKEGAFSKIVRMGDSPANYTWEVTDKSGTKYYYGKKDSDGSMKGVLMGKNHENNDVIAEWKLVRIQEVHGDWVEYEYENIQVDGFSTSTGIRLTMINAGNSEEKAHTVVKLSYDREVTNTEGKIIRARVTTNGRYGFLCGQDYLLTNVFVYYSNSQSPLRYYEFDYDKGQFETVLLTAIKHMKDKDNEVSKNTFAYHDNVVKGELFTDIDPVKVCDDDKIEVYGPDFLAKLTGNLSVLGSSSSLSGSVDVYAGVGVNDGNLLSKANSGGVSYTFNYSSSKGAVTYMDIDGDGLSDMVFKNGNNGDRKTSVYYRPCLPDSNSFGPAIPIFGIEELSKSSSTTNTIGGKGHIGIGDAVATIGGDYGSSETTTTVYFSDVNGDGLIDLVTEEEVMFNRLVWDVEFKRFVPKFEKGSANTSNPIYASNINLSDPNDESYIKKTKELEDETIENAKQNPMHDVVRVWIAPFKGTVNISGTAMLVGKNSDGIVLSVQKEAELKQKVSLSNEKLSASVIVNKIDVEKGDRLFFRVQCGDKYNASGIGDNVEWSPIVSYEEKFGVDANGLSLETYDSEKDFFLQMYNTASIESKENYYGYSEAKFVVDINKKIDLTDKFDIEVVLLEMKKDGDSNDKTETILASYNFDEQKGMSKKTIDNLFENMKEGYVYSISCNLKTKSNIDFNNVEVLPRIEYSGNDGKIVGKTQKLIPGFSIFSNNLYYGRVRDISPVLSQIEKNSQWINGISLIEDPVSNEMSLTWKEKHLISVDKDNIETEEDEEVIVPVSSIFPEFYVVPNFEYTGENAKNVPLRLVLKKDGKCEHIYFDLDENGAYNPIQLQKEESLLSEYLLNQDGESTPSVWMEYYTDSDFDGAVLKSELRIYAIHTTNYEYTIVDQYGNQSVGTKENTITLFDSKLEDIAFHGVTSDIKYGPMYRNWGQFGYIANEYNDLTENIPYTRYAEPLTLKYLVNDLNSKYTEGMEDKGPEYFEDENNLPKIDKDENAFVTLVPDAESEMWVGIPKEIDEKGKQKNINGIGRSLMLTSRSGKQDVIAKDPMARFEKLSGTSAAGIELITKSTSVNSNVGFSGYSLNVGWNGKGGSKTAFMDMNGDGYPDVIENGRIRYTNYLGGLSKQFCFSDNILDESNSQGLGLGKGHSLNMFPNNSKTSYSNSINNSVIARTLASEASASFGGRISKEHNDYATVDMNGDGLPDKVRYKDDKIYVSLNIGYRFSDEVSWGEGSIRKSLSFSINGGTDAGASKFVTKITEEGLAFSMFASSISGGLSASAATTNTMCDIRDVNGDGLPDLTVSKSVEIPGRDKFPYSLLTKRDKYKDVIENFNSKNSEIFINTGKGFVKTDNYEVPSLGKNTSNSASLNGNYTAGFPVMLAKIVASGGGAASGSYSTTDCSFSDFDGDGFPDILESSDIKGVTCTFHPKLSPILIN